MSLVLQQVPFCINSNQDQTLLSLLSTYLKAEILKKKQNQLISQLITFNLLQFHSQRTYFLIKL